jgi:hypothetical protein
MKKLVIVSALIFISNISNAQNFEWAKAIGGSGSDHGRSLTVDHLGNIYSTGSFSGTVDFDPGLNSFYLTAVDSIDIFVIKLDDSGNLTWAKSFGSAFNNYGGAIVVDSSYNIYIAGAFQGVVDFDPSPAIFNLTSLGSRDIFLIKLDSSGNFAWGQSFGSNNNDYCYSIVLDKSANIIITGGFYETGSGWDIFISKFDSFGNIIWGKTLGGPFFDWGFSVTSDHNDNVYSTGGFQGTVDFDPGPGVYNLTSSGLLDIYIIKFDSSGNFMWAKAFSGSQSALCYSIAVDLSGNIYTTGFFHETVDFDPGLTGFYLSSTGGFASDAFISKLDSAGNFLWAKSIGGSNPDVGQSITVDINSTLYITGTFYGTADFDPSQQVFNLSSVDSSDIFILKLDSDGNFLWAGSLGGVGNNFSSLILVKNNLIYTTGSFEETVDFDTGQGIYNISSSGGRDIFIHKMSYITGIEEFGSSGFSVYPNPANDKIIISSEDIVIGEVKIYDIVGKLIKIDLINDINAEVDVTDLKSGLYFLELVNQRFKIIKQ